MTARRAAAPLAALALALLTALAVLLADDAVGHYPLPPSQPCGNDHVQVKFPWTTIKGPDGLDQITTQATGGIDGKDLLASDGRRVMHSPDGGCTWKDSFDVETAALPDSDALPRVAMTAYPKADSRTAFVLLDGVARAAGSRVLKSDDGGATFTQVTDGVPLAGGVRDIVGAGNHVYVSVALNDAAGDNGVQGSGVLYRSTDGGRSFSEQSQGVQIERIADDPQDPERLWVVRADHTVQRSDDGGENFTLVTLAGDPAQKNDPTLPDLSAWGGPAMAHPHGDAATIVLAASPSRTADVTRVVVSEDGGESFKDISAAGLGPVAGLAFGNSADQVLFLAASDATSFHGPGMQAFDIEYGRWRDVDTREFVSLREARPVVLSTGSRGHEGYQAIQMRRDAPGESPPLPDLIVRYTPPDPPPPSSLTERFRCEKGADPPATHPPHKPEHSVTFAPDDLDLALQPGKPAQLPITADLDPQPTPVDLDFLVDSSTSMDPALDGIRCSIERLAQDLIERNTDAQFGLGTYSDYSQTGRFSRRLDISPYGPALHDALKNLLVKGGTWEPLRGALYQTATGAGLHTREPYTPNDPTDMRTIPVTVPPGQQANFRKGVVRLVALIADEPYEQDHPNDEPSRDQVVNALRERNIRMLGLQVVPATVNPGGDSQNGTVEQDPGRRQPRPLILNQQMRDFAGATGAVAPPGGVDCDGGGSPDLQAGEPLVCPIDERGIRENFGDTIEAVLRSIRDIGGARIVPLPESELPLHVDGGSADGIDLKRRNELTGTATVSCTPAQAGRTYRIGYGVEVRGKIVDKVTGEATCGALAASIIPRRPPRHPSTPAPLKTPKPAPAAPHAAQQPALPAAPAPQPPNPAPVIAPQPPPPAPAPVNGAPASSAAAAPTPAAAPAPSAQPAPMAGIAGAPTREAAPQAAVVDTRGGGERGGPAVAGEHAMTAWRPTRHTQAVPEPALITLGVGIAGAFGYGAFLAGQRRRRPRLAAQRVPTRSR